ncbi:MAG TPA: diacylglycerol kinase family protein [Prolixibacteraceae bacterium]|nr:diacylglycerol kinase family protein [Prolixibacteraceae bacterium]
MPKSYFNKLMNSFKYATNGIAQMFKSELNAKIHLVVAMLVIGAGFLFDVTRFEWLILILLIGMVLVAEGLNTAIEHLADSFTLEKHPEIGKAKDIAAGAVLLAAITAAIIGLLLFIPHFAAWLNSL